MQSRNPNDVIFVLANILRRPPASVEILPGGLEDWLAPEIVDGSRLPSPEFPFLDTDNNIGVPKKVLFSLYLVAVKLFTPLLSELSSAEDVQDKQRCLACTSVILLANPAHNTALNYRKRLLQTGFVTEEQELKFTDIVLRSTGEGAKQSIIWDHRRWLFNRFYFQGRQLSPEAILHEDIRREFGLIRQACRIYPRNYHAWSYWRQLMGSLSVVMSGSPEKSTHLVRAVAEEFDYVRQWIDTNVSDYTAMHHFVGAAGLFHGTKIQYLDVQDDSGGAALLSLIDPQALAHHAWSLLSHYRSHEALWMYFRLTISLLPVSQRQNILSKAATILDSQDVQATRARVWFMMQGAQLSWLDGQSARKIMSGEGSVV